MMRLAILGAGALLLLAAPAVGQVTAVAELRNNVAELSVGPVGTTQRVTIMLYRDGGPATVLGNTVRALVSPSSFTLEPGVIQTVRIKVREAVGPGELLRVATLFVPQESTTEGQTVALRVAMRLVSKLRAAP